MNPRLSRRAMYRGGTVKSAAYASSCSSMSADVNSRFVRGLSGCALLGSRSRNGARIESVGCDVSSSFFAARKSCCSSAVAEPPGPSTASDAFVKSRSFGYPSADRTAPRAAAKGRYPRRAQMRLIAAFASSLAAIEPSARARARVEAGKSGSRASSNGSFS